VVEHLVLLRLKPGVTPEEVDGLLAAIRGLPARVPGILGLQCGRNFSPDRAQGYDLGIHVRFARREDLAAYGPHPEHQKVVARIQDLCAGLIAVDFEA
jgi:hypothetical protein